MAYLQILHRLEAQISSDLRKPYLSKSFYNHFEGSYVSSKLHIRLARIVALCRNHIAAVSDFRKTFMGPSL